MWVHSNTVADIFNELRNYAAVQELKSEAAITHIHTNTLSLAKKLIYFWRWHISMFAYLTIFHNRQIKEKQQWSIFHTFRNHLTNKPDWITNSWNIKCVKKMKLKITVNVTKWMKKEKQNKQKTFNLLMLKLLEIWWYKICNVITLSLFRYLNITLVMDSSLQNVVICCV